MLLVSRKTQLLSPILTINPPTDYKPKYVNFSKSTTLANMMNSSPQLLPTPASTVLGSDQVKADKTTMEAIKTHSGGVKTGESVTVTTTTTTTTVISKSSAHTEDQHHQRARPYPYSNNVNNISAGHGQPMGGPYGLNGHQPMEPGWVGVAPASPPRSPLNSPPLAPYNGGGPMPLPPPPPLPMGLPPLDLRPPSPLPIAPPLATDSLEDDNSLVIGLKVFTRKSAPTVITGRLKNPTPYNDGFGPAMHVRY